MVSAFLKKREILHETLYGILNMYVLKNMFILEYQNKLKFDRNSYPGIMIGTAVARAEQ